MQQLNDKLQVVIRKREGILFEGEAWALSSINDVGPFDVLAYHSNFVSPLNEKIVVHISRKETKEFVVNKGVMRVEENKVEVYVGI